MSEDLDQAIRRVEALGAQRRIPTRHDARPVLLLLGENLLAGGEATSLAAARERLQTLPAATRESWEAAVREEIAMACTEHVRSVDPRYLAHPDYDIGYTVSARRRLECRLAAAEFLGLPPEESLRGAVERADRLLERRRLDPRHDLRPNA